MKIALIVLIAVLIAVGVAGVLVTAQWTVDDPNLYINWDLSIDADENDDGTYTVKLRKLYTYDEITMTVCSEEVLEEMESLRIFSVTLDLRSRVVKVHSAQDMGYTWAARDFYVKDWGGDQLQLTPDRQLLEDHTTLELPKARIWRIGDFADGGLLEKYDRVSILTHDHEDPIIFVCDRLYGRYDFCLGCKKEVLWHQWKHSDQLPHEAGHYYLLQDVEANGEVRLAAGQDLCLDLAGNTVTQTAPGKSIYALEGSRFHLMNSQAGEGAMIPGGGEGGSCFYVGQNSSLRLIGGVLDGRNVRGSEGLCVVNDGTLTLDGGTLYGGIATGDGGGAVYNRGSFTVLSGLIEGGHAADEGGVSLGGGCVLNSGEFVMTGGTVRQGRADTAGGCISSSGKVVVGSGEVYTGTAPKGSNVYVLAGGVLEMTPGVTIYNVAYE